MRTPLKRSLVAIGLALCLAAPAHAVGPLAAILIDYVKTAVKQKIVAYARSKAMGMVSDAAGEVPGMGMLAMVSPGLLGGLAPRPSLSQEAKQTLDASGLLDTSAKPLTDDEWAEYAQAVATMARGAGADEIPDIDDMRAAMQAMPQLSGLMRASLEQFRAIRAEQARMRELYAQMPDHERQEVADELVRTFAQVPAEERVQARQVLQSDALGLHDDLKLRLLAALP